MNKKSSVPDWAKTVLLGLVTNAVSFAIGRALGFGGKWFWLLIGSSLPIVVIWQRKAIWKFIKFCSLRVSYVWNPPPKPPIPSLPFLPLLDSASSEIRINKKDHIATLYLRTELWGYMIPSVSIVHVKVRLDINGQTFIEGLTDSEKITVPYCESRPLRFQLALNETQVKRAKQIFYNEKWAHTTVNYEIQYEHSGQVGNRPFTLSFYLRWSGDFE